MSTLEGKRVIVVGVGRSISTALKAERADILAIGRGQEALDQLKREVPGALTLIADATDPSVPRKAFAALFPDILVVSLGAVPHMAPIHEQDWDQFTRTWETDVKASFHFCREALRAPLKPGSTVILISGGPGIGGSLLSGGLSGAKRMQLFMADFCQKQSDRLNLGIRFVALAPLRIMSTTEIGRTAAEGYAAYLGMTVRDFLDRQESPQTTEDVARAVLSILLDPTYKQTKFIVSGAGIKETA